MTDEIRTGHSSHACHACGLRQLCSPAGLDLRAPDSVARARKSRVPRGACLYRADQPLRAVYAIRAGFMKSRLLNAEGREQVAGFHMRGEVLGLDGVGTGRHLCDAVALEDCEICEIPFSTVERLCGTMPSLQRHVWLALGREIVSSRLALMALCGTRAEERVAAFLLDLSRRFGELGYSPCEFELRMKREEIASFLGMQIETASRVLSQLQDQRIVEVRRRRVRILDLPRLRALAHRAMRRPRAAPRARSRSA